MMLQIFRFIYDYRCQLSNLLYFDYIAEMLEVMESSGKIHEILKATAMNHQTLALST
jgi:hypothetical protein